ncbi:MAG: radical SAM protein [Nanoarchaeota archaeon]
MKLTIIQPAIGKKDDKNYVRTWQMEPLAPAIIASLTPKDVQIVFYDDRIEQIPYYEPTDLVAMPVETFTAKRAYIISSKFRERDIPVVLGGIHPTLVPEEAIKYADSVIVGEAESVWRQVIEDFKNNNSKKIYYAEKTNLIQINPDRSIFEGKNYLPLALVETGRGCVFSCDFCAIFAVHKGSHRRKPIQDVVEEIRSLKQKNVFLVDDNITANVTAAKELFKALKPLKIKWISQATVNIAHDDGLLKLMVDAGCVGLLIGFESLSPENLKIMNKSWNISLQNYHSALKKIRDNGLVLYGTFIFGYNYDSEETFKEVLEFAVKEKFFIAAFNYVMPFPKTPLYKRFEEEGMLVYDKWWLDEKYHFGDVAFKPKSMTTKQLEDRIHDIRNKFYSLNSMIRRMEFKANCKNVFNLALFYSLNYSLRSEIFQKRGLPLGDDKLPVEKLEFKKPMLTITDA